MLSFGGSLVVGARCFFVNKIRKKTTCKFKQNKRYRMDNYLWKGDPLKRLEKEKLRRSVLSLCLQNYADREMTDWSAGPLER